MIYFKLWKLLFFGVLTAIILNFSLLSPVFASPPLNFQTTQIIGSGLNGPSGFEIAPDGRIFILERSGKVKIFKNGTLLDTPFADLPSVDSGDRGLIGIAFDPDYDTNHYVYFYYTGLDLLNKLVRFNAAGDVGTEGPVILYETKSPSQLLHVGGSIRFGPDGKLYFAVGDNGYPPNAQDLSNPHGKILRINKDGTVPADNPFFGQSGKLGEIWAYGLRNPWRFQFDSQTGQLYGGDVGNYTWEEVNKIVKGGNYGWPNAEGTCNNCPYINPLYTYNHDDQSSSITGGPVYRATLFPQDYYGSYFFGDYARGFIKRIILDSNGNFNNITDFDNAAGSVVDLKIGSDGSLYYITYYPGKLYKVNYELGNHTPTVNAVADILKGIEPLTVHFKGDGSFDPDGDTLSFSWEFGDGSKSSEINPVKTYSQKGTYTVELTISDGFHTSQSVPIVIQVGTPPTLTIGAPKDGENYKAGDTINYTAFANDGAGFDLNDGQIKTEVLFHHGTHIHPFLGPLTGRAGSFVVPTGNHESSSDTYFEIKVTATDTSSLSTTKSVFIYPLKSQITFSNVIQGLKILLDGIPTITTSTITGVVGYLRELSAPTIQVLNGKVYQFTNWADNGPWKRIISAQATDTNYVANFVESPAFKAEFFNNIGLTGTPVLTRNDNLVNFEWFDASPGLGVNPDVFSVRWSKKQTFSTGKYTFKTSTDDGVRLFIDNNLVIDKWIDQGVTSYEVTLDLSAGEHTIVMEYYDKVGWATAQLTWDFIAQITDTPTDNFSVEYFDNQNLTGQPKYLDNVTAVNFNFQQGSPNSQIPNDHFSARFKKSADFENAIYQFNLLADDGVRLFIDGELVLDKWIDQPPTLYSVSKTLSAGKHTIVIEYFENQGGAVIEFNYKKTDQPIPTPTPFPTPTPTPISDPNYQAKYWNLSPGTQFTIPNNQPDLDRTDNEINFNWGSNSPDPKITNNNFITRWIRNIVFENANYKFHTVSDDGIRVYLNDQMLIDDWNDHAAKDDYVIKTVTAGLHKVTVEYYENSGDAVAIFNYQKTLENPNVTPTPTSTPGPVEFVGQYFNNIDLSGSPVLTRNTPDINFKWGNTTPDPLLSSDKYSIRWTKKQTFAAGSYQFRVVADDGVRLIIDGIIVIDKWINQPPTEYTVNKDLSAGEHTIILEYFEDQGEATAILSY